MGSFYDRYIKPRYANDPEFRARILADNARHAEGGKALDPLAYSKKRSEYSKRCYDNHPEYKERKRLYSRLYRLHKLQLANCIDEKMSIKPLIPPLECPSTHQPKACMTEESYLSSVAPQTTTSSQSRRTLPI